MKIFWLLFGITTSKNILDDLSINPEPNSEPADSSNTNSNHKKWKGDEFSSIFGLSINDIPQKHIAASADLEGNNGYVELPRSRTGSSNHTMAGLRKFRQLKSMILFLQQEPNFGKYCWYGCWCFIEGSYNLQTGYGKPRDEIDSACMRFSKCYRCLNMDYENFTDDIAYDFSVGNRNANDVSQKTLSCHDPPGSMKRSLCECDKELAYQLREYELEWQEKFHEKWGGFDRRHECWVKNGNNPTDDCCGNYPHRYPYSTGQGSKACCVNKVYGVEYFKCVNGVIVDG